MANYEDCSGTTMRKETRQFKTRKAQDKTGGRHYSEIRLKIKVELTSKEKIIIVIV
jgi:hypothetical protein